MASVPHYFLLVLVLLDSHAAQLSCLPGCACSEESFGRCAGLARSKKGVGEWVFFGDDVAWDQAKIWQEISKISLKLTLVGLVGAKV